MAKLEEVYKRLEKSTQRKREIGKMLKDELAHNPRHSEIIEEIKILREEKKSIEQDIRASTTEFMELDDLKIDIATDQELLSDIALNMYTNNETVEITDDYDNTWYPVFKVSFKKEH